MKLVKSLLLGSAAGLVAVAGAQAADLPVRAAAPVDYVRVCPTPGAGFQNAFLIPGTQTCLQISGYVRSEYRFAERNTRGLPLGATTRGQDDLTFFVRGRIAMEARTPTDFGTLRSVVALHGERGGNAGALDATVLDVAFIQFAGLTAGRITSFFDFFTGNMMTAHVVGADATTEVLAYTADFGSGITATVSIENATRRRVSNTNLVLGGTPIIYGGQNLPDLVANLRVAQSWGSAQIMGALHQIRHNNGPGINDELGWAVGAGVQINLPMIAQGDRLWLQATYADGALGYLGLGNAFNVESFGVGLADAYVINNGLSTSKGYVLAAAFRHFWTPQISQDLQFSYGFVDSPIPVAPVPLTVATGTAQDFTFWQLGTRLIWTPVSGLSFSADVVYTKLDADIRVVPGLNRPARDDDSFWAGRLRIQRDF